MSGVQAIQESLVVGEAEHLKGDVERVNPR
jgi:hypothetical protein